MTHPENTTPANPAQGVIRQIIEDALNSAIPESWEVAEHATQRILAAIGAGNETPAGKWAIDRSTDSPILTYENCSVIQDEQAFYVLGLIRDAIGAGGQAVAFASRQSGILEFDVNGAEIINVLLHPKGTLRPENEIPVYAAPVPPVVGEDSPYPWKSVRQVPGTSVVNGSTMLLDAEGACIGLVTVLNADDNIRVEIARALDTAGDIAKTRRNIIAARHGEEEANARAEAAEAALAAASPTGAVKDVEALAEFLCSEFDFDLNPVVGAHWPEHPNDDGYRDGGYVKLQPTDVQAHARDNAKRILTFLGQRATLASSVAKPCGVKALEWEETWNGHNDDIPTWRGNNPLGIHVRISFAGKYKLESHSDAPAAELAERKAAAQADYERSILSCLDAPVPATPAQGATEALHTAAAVLVAKLDGIHADPDYRRVWEIAQLHGGKYIGPNYINELASLRAALASREAGQ